MMKQQIARLCLAVTLLPIAAGPAEAWKRPKAEPDAKLASCPEMGEGFVRIPGSTTCVRMSGLVRAEAAHISR